MNIHPLKRNIVLQPLSREHHDGLLLCWKIKQGIEMNIEPERIKQYLNWFWQEHLLQHFYIEEKYIFPLLEPDDELVIRAIEEHRFLKELFESQEKSKSFFSTLEQTLNEHIRFEERILFNKIQEVKTTEQLLSLLIPSNILNRSVWDDEFWRIK